MKKILFILLVLISMKGISQTDSSVSRNMRIEIGVHKENQLITFIELQIKMKEDDLHYWDSAFGSYYDYQHDCFICTGTDCRFFMGEINGRRIQLIQDLEVLKEEKNTFIK